MRAKFFAVLTAALLLCGLAACQTGTWPPEGSDPSFTQGSGPSKRPAIRPGTISEGSSEPSEPPLSVQPADEGPEWDPSYRLNIQYPQVSKGALELPIHGATGYASVEMGLWEEIPEPEPEPEPEAPGDTSAPDQDTPSVPPETPPDSSEEPSASSEAPPATPEEPASPDASSSSGQEPDPSAGDPASSQQPAQSVLPEPPLDPSLGYLPQEPQEPQEPQDPQPSEPAPSEPGPEQTEPVEPEPEPDPYEGALAVLAPGTAFTILEEYEDWWRVDCEAGTGWVPHRYCFINLPDVIPSMVYDATNAYNSRFVSIGKRIPDVTGRAFYKGTVYNPRLDREEFMMPVLYAMSKRICQAQQAALAQGNTLVLYEGFRPYETQRVVYRSLSTLAKTDPEVRAGISSSPWDVTWFIAAGSSNHQQGYAMDVGLARVDRAKLQDIGGHQVLRVMDYQLYTMPTPIHELSQAAATFTAPVAIFSATAWKSATLADSMNEPAIGLQGYCTGAGLTPLASEWWHFNDLDAYHSSRDNPSLGNYQITQCRSTAP